MFNHRLCVQKVLCIRTLKLSFFPWFREKNKSIYKMIFVYNFCATQEFFSHKIQCPKSKSETNEIILLLVCLSALNRTIHKNMFCWGRWEIKDQHKCIGFIIYSINVSLLTFIELTYSVNIWVLFESFFSEWPWPSDKLCQDRNPFCPLLRDRCHSVAQVREACPGTCSLCQGQ